MCYTINSIKIGNIIAPQNNIEFRTEGMISILILMKGSLSVEWRKKREEVHEKSIIIGRKFRGVNNTSELVSTFSFSFNECLLDKYNMLNSNHFKIYDKDIESVYNLICGFSKNEHDFYQLYHNLENHLSEILHVLFEKSIEESVAGKTFKGKIDPRLIIINRYIRENYYKEITLTVLAELICCNPVYLSNTYSKVFQISPMKYLQDFRMRKAKKFLTKTDMPVNKIANQLGYISNSQFNNLFKRYFNITPTQFRLVNSMRNNQIK